MSAWDARSTTTVSSRRDLFGGAVPTVVLDFDRSRPESPKLNLEPAKALALARELRRAAKALSPNARAER